MDENVKNKKKVKRNVPNKEADLNFIAANVVASWEQHPQFILTWTSVAELKSTITDFNTAFAGRSDVKGSRRSVTQELKVINAEIDTNIEQLKGYLADVYSKKEALAHYESCGIVKGNKHYKLPFDNDSRLYALEQLLKGIVQHGLADRKYGTRYWEDVHKRFVKAKATAIESDKTSAKYVSSKTNRKAAIRKTLNALMFLIRANYPDTWREELRIWGFQKEKY